MSAKPKDKKEIAVYDILQLQKMSPVELAKVANYWDVSFAQGQSVQLVIYAILDKQDQFLNQYEND
jgi:hypothetical protein